MHPGAKHDSTSKSSWGLGSGKSPSSAARKRQKRMPIGIVQGIWHRPSKRKESLEGEGGKRARIAGLREEHFAQQGGRESAKTNK